MKRLAAVALALILAVWSGAALADQWGMSGEMSRFLKKSGDYDDVKYPELNSGYSPKAEIVNFIIRKGDENLLVILRRNAKGELIEEGRYPGALRKLPAGKNSEFWNSSREGTIQLKNMWSKDGEEYIFAWDGQEMILRYANMGTLTISLNEDGAGYAVCDGSREVHWLERPLLLAEFRMDMLPDSLAQLEAANHLAGRVQPLIDLSGRVRFAPDRKTTLPVFAAPFADSFRGAEGKAAVSLREPFDVLAALEDDWYMIEYEISRAERRIGFVQGLEGVTVQTLNLQGHPAQLTSDVTVTDDPHASCRPLCTLKQGAEAEVLGWLDAFWLCIQTEAEGKRAWGFIPAGCVELLE